MEYEHEISIDENTGGRIQLAFGDESCLICHGDMITYKEPITWTPDYIKEFDEILISSPAELFSLHRKHLFVRSKCSWWHSNERAILYPLNITTRNAYQYSPAIEEIDIRSSQIAIKDLIFHLTHRWNDRKLLSASAAESLVASLLKEHLKCDVISATAKANTPDDGVDLYVCHNSGEVLAAVQVKRRISRQVEGVSEVRNFVGALAIESISKGIFVTTATRYTRNAEAVSEKLKSSTSSRLELELLDGRDLFELLKTLPREDKLILPKDAKADDVCLHSAGNDHTTRKILYGY